MYSITLTQLGWATPDGQPILSDLNLRFRRERTGIVGRNGVGKSTLLHLLTGQLAPSSGSISINCRLAMLRQTVQVEPGETIADLFCARAALDLLRRVEAGGASAADIGEADWTLEARIDAALAAVSLTLAPDTPLTQLSGGQRTRAALAGAMFGEPDFLVLDEPTNNLDREGRQAVRDLVRDWPGGAIIVSHDRELLEEMDAIVEMSSLGAARYGGGWSAFRALKQVEQAATEAERARAESQFDRVHRQAQKAAERRARRDAGGRRKAARGDEPAILLGTLRGRAEESSGAARRVAERQRSAAKAALITARSQVEVIDPLSVGLPSTGLPPSRIALELDRITAGYTPGHAIIDGLSLTITGPERVAITGPNGSGKSTLLALISGTLTPWAGKVRTPLSFAMLDQRVSLLDPVCSIAANFFRLNPGTTNNQCRAALARFRFRAEAADRIVGTLSGGQMLRAGLACILGAPTPPSLLILDEPGNHLDLDSLTTVESGLAAYDGALLVVSHDPAFLDSIRIERTVKLG